MVNDDSEPGVDQPRDPVRLLKAVGGSLPGAFLTVNNSASVGRRSACGCRTPRTAHIKRLPTLAPSSRSTPCITFTSSSCSHRSRLSHSASGFLPLASHPPWIIRLARCSRLASLTTDAVSARARTLTSTTRHRHPAIHLVLLISYFQT